ncbi:sensor domain-containing diguanylate cyclase [Mycolicibacterium mucogenicum]|uniref:GGDEF domain-containing protein n=1 Tax=Mycolicibacterium mucogenicum TaxID=56689 RepID=A0A4R5WCP5_MYCMU|nr:GGDEF domain-containing protein [Mycolicibacterium mucogenicum]TDK87451.1 GGDEF domain-containing protein [Mycolicibacterium mucogenicum]
MLTRLRELLAVARLARVWWSEPVDYDAQIGYFAQRGLLGGVQLLVGGCAALLAAISIVIQLSPAGPSTALARGVSSVFAVSALVWALVWWFGPWPSRATSIAFIMYADIGISVVALLDSNRLAGFFGLNALLLISVYAKFFEGPRVLALHTAWVLLVIGVFAADIAWGPHGDPYLALAKTLAAIASFVVVPAVVQFGIWVMRNDAHDSVTDQLTGLLNRRGLNLRIEGFLADRAHQSIPGACVTVLVIDLDRFKNVNDTYGHAVGDAVLMRSAERIRGVVRSSALVARVGGEEFVVVDVTTPQQVLGISERIRAAIAATADMAPVTASIGVASIALPDFSGGDEDPQSVLDATIECADHAMFSAKRSGGNAAVRLTFAVGNDIVCRCDDTSTSCDDPSPSRRH